MALRRRGSCRGPLKLNVHATGELRAGRTVTMITPPVGGMLRIVRMISTGIPVKAGEVVMEFDPRISCTRSSRHEPSWPRRSRRS